MSVMRRTAWPNAMTLDVPAMDQPHHLLFGELSDLAGLPESEFTSRFRTMVADLERDFYAEDEWMERLDYPETHSHREQHAIASSALHHAHSQVMAGDIELGRIVAVSLRAWLTDHIVTMDLQLARAIRRASVR
jgi:hemerythrin-like metal-binding protein